MWTVKRPLAKTQGFLVNFVDWGTGSGDPLTLCTQQQLSRTRGPQRVRSRVLPHTCRGSRLPPRPGSAPQARLRVKKDMSIFLGPVPTPVGSVGSRERSLSLGVDAASLLEGRREAGGHGGFRDK